MISSHAGGLYEKGVGEEGSGGSLIRRTEPESDRSCPIVKGSWRNDLTEMRDAGYLNGWLPWLLHREKGMRGANVATGCF
jgi:hypothetical protein